MTHNAPGTTRYEVTRFFSDLLPVRGDQEILCGQLVRSARYCERLSPRAWSIALLDRGFCLTIGQTEAMLVLAHPAASHGSHHPADDDTLVLVQILLAGSDVAAFEANLAPGSQIETVQDRLLPGPIWRYTGSFVASSGLRPHASRPLLVRDLRVVAPAHHLLIELAAHAAASTNAKQRPLRRARDTVAVYEYASDVCGVRYSRVLGLAQARPIASRQSKRAV